MVSQSRLRQVCGRVGDAPAKHPRAAALASSAKGGAQKRQLPPRRTGNGLGERSSCTWSASTWLLYT